MVRSSQPGFKYADAQEISNASLRPGCLQPQTLPHHYANFRLQQQEATAAVAAGAENNRSVPDVIQQLQVTEADEEARADRHVIVNQLLTFLTEKQQQQQQQQQQLIDLSSEAASTTSTIKLTDTPN